LAGVNIPYITNPFWRYHLLDSLRINFQFSWASFNPGLGGSSGASLDRLDYQYCRAGQEAWMANYPMCSISSFIIGLLSLRLRPGSESNLVTYLSFATAGAFFGFLPWNYFPQKNSRGMAVKLWRDFFWRFYICPLVNWGRLF